MARLRQVAGDSGQPVDDYGSVFGGQQAGPQPQGDSGQPPIAEPPTPSGGGSGEEGGGNVYRPNENFPSNVPNQPLSSGHATPPQPMEPTPRLGVSSGPSPFQPMPSAPPELLAAPRLRGLMGATGGLQGGGLGVPGSSVGTGNDPISALIQQLLMKR